MRSETGFGLFREHFFRVTGHAVERYRQRVDPEAGEEEIKNRLFEAYKSAKKLGRHLKDGERLAGAGLVFGVVRRGCSVIITTVYGREEEYRWNRHTFRMAAKRARA